MIRTIYGFDDLGRKVPTGSYDDGAKAVGGRIFYIDSNSDETVEFYDAQGNVISNIIVGDTPAYYKITSAGISGKDKFYVYNPSAHTLIPKHNPPYGTVYWGYYEINTGVNGTAIGTGKTNTSAILLIEDTSDYSSPGLFPWLSELNAIGVENQKDWYIPSKDELIQLRDYLHDNDNGSTIVDIITGAWTWTSSDINSLRAWNWYNASMQEVLKAAGKYQGFAIRSF